MQVFKLCFKIIKKQLPQIMIYITIFLSISIIFSVSQSGKPKSGFTVTRTNVAVINQDGDSALINGFIEYLKKGANMVTLEDNNEKLQDALFFREAEYIIKIPKGFTSNFMNGKAMVLDKITVPDSASAIYTDMNVNKYFSTAGLYLKNTTNISQEQLVDALSKDLSIETTVRMAEGKNKVQTNSFVVNYFNYLAYVLLSVLILGIGSILIVFKKDLKRRNLCSPVPITSINLQLILGNLVFAILCWAIMTATCFILYRDSVFNKNTIYLCINSFIFMTCALSISFLVGILVKSRNAQSAAANVLSLGLCFVSGVFVPQAIMGETVLKISSFTPTYWYVKANNAIGNLSNFSFSNLEPILSAMLIQLGFTVAIISIALVVGKKRPE